MRHTTTLVALLVMAPWAAAQPQPNESPLLIEPATLAAHLDGEPQFGDRQVTLIDVRPAEAYRQGAIGNARHVNPGQWKAAFGDGTDAAAWSERIGTVLAGPRSTVVVYNGQFSPSAARVWWILKYWGVEDVRILNGGMTAWRAEVGRTTPPAEADNQQPPVDFQATPHPERLARFGDVQQIASDPDRAVCLVDVRTDQENAAGAIPTARHLNWEELVDPQSGKLRDPDELQSLLARIGFDPENPAVTYCQSGGRASVMAFAIELVGGKPAANYYGSWGDWSERTADSSATDQPAEEQ